jgi:hypothetical protein
MMKNLLILVALLCSISVLHAQNIGTIQGKVTEEGTGEPVIFCNVILYKGGMEVTGATTDLDGNYSVSNLDPGDYDVEVSYVGYQPQLIKGVRVFAGRVIALNIELSQGVLLEGVTISDYRVPLIEQDNTTQGRTITSEEIRNLPLKDINAIASSTAGISSIDGESVAIRGSRSNATDYYIDGVRVRGALVPQFEIEQLQVITGGLEAMYGDVTGGVISITTKGPASRFGGGAEFETSEGLDAFGYTEGNLNISGPLVKRGNQSILGFRASYRGVWRRDDSPAATGVYRAPLSLIEELERNPMGIAGGITPFSNAETLRNSDIELRKTRPNEQRRQHDLTARIDARLSKAIDISVGGSYRDTRDRFTPGGWGLLNYNRNPYSFGQSFRTNLRFRHRLGLGATSTSGQEGSPRASTIQNAIYTIQVGYEQSNSSQEDLNHGDNLFRYGHVGDFPFTWEPAGGILEDGTFGHAGFLRSLEGAYTPSAHNPALAAYNNILTPAQLNQFDNYFNVNGFRNPVFNNAWGFHTNVGSVFNSYAVAENNIFTLNLNASFDFLPGGSEKGRHNIQFGILHEQRVDRNYSVAPFGLYQLARLGVNSHLIGVDYNAEPVGVHPQGWNIYPPLTTELQGVRFYRSVREAFDFPLGQYFNIDGVNPDDLSLSMFSPSELTDQGVISFSGYDYLGNKTSRDISFNDFFTQRDAEGNRQFLVTPNQPIYQAFFIQDKFTFKDIIFRLGLRVDRFDANTQIMRDPFSLYDIMTASDFFESFGGERPANIGDNYKVYVESEGSTSVRAFRNGEQWFTGNGTPVNDGNFIWGGELVTPRYYDDLVNNIKSVDFDPDRSFESYTPQLNWMPRVSVSFPISDEANFFAHYDILVQRPPSNTFESPLGYYYFVDFPSSQDNPRNNPALRPERTIDYEVGFQQRLTAASAVKMSAFYRELRDMIQIREFLYVPPPVNRYTSFDNLDFGTVKGFQFQYELRRTKNISLLANYTLQFADGTGSDATSQRGISQRGNLRTLFPLSRDERHAIKGVFDFRYESGKRYNGPRLFGKDIFANSGFNFQFNAISGRPYTRRQRPTPLGGTGFLGSINGARLPWNYNIDLRVEKSFKLTPPEAANQVNMTLSLRVLNLLDTRNIRGVYPASGSPFDSGFLASSDGAAALRTATNVGADLIAQGRTVEAYVDSYSWALLQPGFFSLPRRIFVAALFDF